MNKEELKQKHPFVYSALEQTHDEKIEYAEMCLEENSDDTAQIVLDEANEIREFFGDEKLTLKDLEE